MNPTDDWDDITERTLALTLAPPSDAPPTERDLEAPTEPPSCAETLPAPPDLPETQDGVSLARLRQQLSDTSHQVKPS